MTILDTIISMPTHTVELIIGWVGSIFVASIVGTWAISQKVNKTPSEIKDIIEIFEKGMAEQKRQFELQMVEQKKQLEMEMDEKLKPIVEKIRFRAAALKKINENIQSINASVDKKAQDAQKNTPTRES